MKRRISDWRFLSSFHRILAFFYPTTLAVFFLGLNSCYNEPETLGGNIIPSSDLLSITQDTSFTVSAYTVTTDSIPGSLCGTAVLGSYNSPIFGKVRAEYRTKLDIEYTGDTILYQMHPRPTPISCKLFLTKAKRWGQADIPMNVTVYELQDSVTSNYYNALGEPTERYYSTPISYPAVYEGDSTLRINLTSEFASKLINAPDSVLTVNPNFRKYVKGLYITTEPVTGTGGVLYAFNYDAYIELAYKYRSEGDLKDTVFTFYTGYYSPRYNHYTHDYTGTPVESVMLVDTTIKSTTPQNPVFYIDGLGGVKGLIKFNGLSEWKNTKMPCAINRAELRFDIDDTTLPQDSVISPLHYYYRRYYDNDFTNQSTDVIGIYDTEITKVETSKYIKAKKYYSIDITLHLQNLLKNNLKQDYIFLEPSDFKTFYDQGVFRSGSNSKPMKLYITYTKL